MKNQIIPSEYHSFLFEQKTVKELLSAVHLISENDQAFKDGVLLQKPTAWMPPFNPLCRRCLTRESGADGYCFLCGMVSQTQKELFSPSDEKRYHAPDAAFWIFNPDTREEQIPFEGLLLLLDNHHSCLFCNRNLVYSLLNNVSWNRTNVIVVELNQTVKHLGNTLLMAQHHSIHIQPQENGRIKFIFSDAQIYASEFIHDTSLVLSREDLNHLLPGVDEIRKHFEYQYLEQIISYFHEDQENKEYLKNKILQLCSLKQKEILFTLTLFEMPKNFALLLLKLARLFNA